MKSRSSTTTVDVRDSGWTPMNHPGTFQMWKPTKKDHGFYNGQRLVWFSIKFCNRTKPSQQSIVRKSTTDNCVSSNRHWSTEEDWSCCKATPGRTFHKSPYENWTNWALKFWLTHHTSWISRQPTTISSSPSITFASIEPSPIGTRQKRRSWTSSNP